MESPFKLAILITIILVGFITFSVLFNNQSDISTEGYVAPSNLTYDNSGIADDLGIFDYLGGILNIKTGLPIIDNIFKSIFTAFISIMILWYLRAAS